MEQKQYLNIAEASAYTRASVKTLRNWVSSRKVPFIKMGGRVVFSVSALDAWMESKAVAAIERGGRP